MTESLYIHIPFCSHICSYCDFPKVVTGTFSEEKYIDSLIDDIEKQSIPDHSLKTIYIGGGTPSALSISSLEKLLSYLDNRFTPLSEFTMEANPESLSKEKISILKKHHINRISLGVESTSKKILAHLNRKHTTEEVTALLKELRKQGFDNISLDFIYGVDTMSEEDLDRDIQYAVSSNVEHLSFYSLQIEEGTVFYNRKVCAKNDDVMASMYEKIRRELKKHGYHRYEVSNFTKNNKESLHNLTYWYDKSYYAAGLGASGYVDGIRYKNTLSMNKYLSGNYRHEEEAISVYDHEFEYIMLHLRLVKGFSLDEFKSIFKKDFLLSYQDNIEKVKDYVQIKEGYFSISEDYLYTMDSILLSLLKLPEDIEKEK